ncbi:MAG: hypothetical protein ACRDHL_11930 [Candidatus Promineifilaceae bacterium]
MGIRRWGAWLIIVGLALAAGRAAAASPAQPAPPLQAAGLANPGLEQPYNNGVAAGWAPQHVEINANPKPENCSAYYSVRPMWSAEVASPALIFDGASAQHIGNQFDTWRAVVMQTLNVTPGARYRFSFYATGRASNEQYPTPSDGNVSMGVQAGIDPNGSADMRDADIVWGPAGSPHMAGAAANWQPFAAETVATGSQITVFMLADFGGANNCRAHLDAWFDGASLSLVAPAATDTPPATATPAATDTPEPTETPVDTPTPRPTATDTPEPTEAASPTPPGGVICANAFDDRNANGRREADEAYMPGVTLTVIQDSELVRPQAISSGDEEPICFDGLEPGAYTVAQVIPRTLELTTAASANIEVSAGTTIALEFGSRPAQAAPAETPAGPTPNSPQAPAEAPDFDRLAIFGLAATGLALLLLAGLIVVLLRRRAA